MSPDARCASPARGRPSPRALRQAGAAIGTCLLLIGADAAAQANSSIQRLCEARATTALEALRNADFEHARSDFSPALAAALDAAELAGRWQALPTRVGTLDAIARVHGGTVAGRATVFIPLIFEHATVTAEFACDGRGAIERFELKVPAAH